MAVIGFGKAPEITEAWEKEVGGITFVFTKTREKERVFHYGCKTKTKHDGCVTSDTSSGFYSDRDLDRKEIEFQAQFLEFQAKHL